MSDDGDSDNVQVQRKANTTITKSKYKALQRELMDKFGERVGCDTVDEILDVMCDVLMFDPNASSYNRERLQKVMAETGKTSYELYGKKAYEMNKEVISKKVAERQKARRAAAKKD